MTSNLPVPQHSLDQYMLEIGRIPLLSRDEEQEVARHLKETGDVDSARRLVAANLRFVVKIAFEYRNYNIRMTDLVQEGPVGLMHAVSKFDPDRGYRLISYAVWWIKAYIQNYIIKNWSMVPISARRKQLFGKARPPEGEDGPGSYLVAAEMDDGPTAHELMIAQRDFSLDGLIGDDSGLTHSSRLPSAAPSAEESVGEAEVRNEVSRAIAAVVEKLDDRGRYILEHRLLADEPASLQDIGEYFGVSRERARQLELRVKEKLKKALSHLGQAEITG